MAVTWYGGLWLFLAVIRSARSISVLLRHQTKKRCYIPETGCALNVPNDCNHSHVTCYDSYMIVSQLTVLIIISTSPFQCIKHPVRTCQLQCRHLIRFWGVHDHGLGIRSRVLKIKDLRSCIKVPGKLSMQ